tara:strand:- start:18 stop:758 length:741 start_codon:yes stop_codon:yes gene_type:complete
MLALVLTLLTALPVAVNDGAPDAANEAWRRGDAASAISMWEAQLSDPTTSSLERARLCHNLGNAAFHRKDPHEAIAWYTAGLRLDSRRGDTFANLEFARLQVGMDPADDGSLTATFHRAIDWMGASGTSWIAMIGVIGLLLCMGGEAMRGGFGWRAAVVSAICLQPLLWAPKVAHLWSRSEATWMVIEPNGTAGYSEPQRSAATVEHYMPGQVLERHDAVGDHVLVSVPGERTSWVREGTLFALER